MTDGTAAINPFRRFPRSSCLASLLIVAAGLLFIAGWKGTDRTDLAAVLQDAAFLLCVAGLWVLFIVGILMERRRKYGAVLLLIGGLFLLSVSLLLPSVIVDLLNALRG